MMNVYFRKTNIPELGSYSQSKKIEILKSIEPHWLEVVCFYTGIGFGIWLGSNVGLSVFSSTDNQWAAIFVGGSIVPIFYFCYEIILLNFITRRKVSAKLRN